MILNKETYLREVKIVPTVDKWQTNGIALDLRIGTVIYRPETGLYEDVGEHGVIIDYKQHFLIRSLEKVTLPNDIMGVVYPRSGTNRKGITVDMTGVVDPGYSGYLMIPVTNMTRRPVQFFAGERIAQIVFERTEPVVEVRESKYHNSDIAAKSDKEEELEVLRDGSLLAAKIKELS